MTLHSTPPLTSNASRQEALSALWDHELSELEARRLQFDEADIATLGRYALMGEALRQTQGQTQNQTQGQIDAGPLVGPGFLASLNRRLDAETQPQRPQPSTHQRSTAQPRAPFSMARLALGSAIAASVALVVVSGVVRYQGNGHLGKDSGLAAMDNALPQQQALAQGSAPRLVAQIEPDTLSKPDVRHNRSSRLAPAVEQQLNRYLVSHGEYARGQGQMLPSVSLVSYGSGR